ncbi:MAG: S8 family peptidase [Planctomycetaceae bacterium]|nr:S8 family peptidase [Planctomycetaceae bacterium]
MQRPEESCFSKRDWKFEACEERLAFSAEPIASADSIADFWIDYTQADLDDHDGPIIPLAAEGHGWNDVAAARDGFGLRGGRQTVAIIDSGIAYDHIALGGGLGKAYRVIGGWDFAENDANPYDDGPAGYHGTHVAGIVGASDTRFPGVAPDADLVALRIFDDQGLGQFTWVESALRWVHQHRNAFENPITTVNLSLGTDWNASTLPNWATFEDELKQLADDGIFISVAAGNSFLVYGTPGLSYPAVSQHVTPVASVDAAGNLSRFSQRSQRVLAAPGERIMSTLPDHFYGGDGVKNDWGATSGTSMAAPYVAGAAVLMREAMQNLGLTAINQSAIYERLKTTADLIYDTATSTTYRRVNLLRALDSLVGVDESTTAADAKNLGTLATTQLVSGTIGRVSDQDFFRFTAAQTGVATLTLNGSSQLAATWQAAGGVGQVNGNKLTLSVQAGQSYVIGVAGGGTTIGKYSIDLRLAAANSGGGSTVNNGGGNTGNNGGASQPVNWGAVDQLRKDGVHLASSDNWFQITATRTATLTVEAMFRQSQGNIDLEVYDAQRRLIATSKTAGNERIDIAAVGGGTYFVRVRGANSDVDFRLTNLVAFAGLSVDVSGTSVADTFTYSAATRQLIVNGVSYGAPAATTVRIDGGSGYDTVTFIGSAAAETATLRPVSLELVGGGISATAASVESTRVIGNVLDTALLYDSAGRDHLDASVTSTTLAGPGFVSSAQGFGHITVIATSGGGDTAQLTGSSGNDTLIVWAGVRLFQGGGTTIRAEGFETLRFEGGDGFDRVDFYTAGKRSWLGGQGDTGWVYAPSFTTEFTDVESLLAHVRSKHKLSTELAALDYVFRKIGV